MAGRAFGAAMGVGRALTGRGGGGQAPDNTDPNEAVQRLVARGGVVGPLAGRLLAKRLSKQRRPGSLESAPVNDAQASSDAMSRARTAAARLMY